MPAGRKPDPDHVRMMKGKSLRNNTLDLAGVQSLKGVPKPPAILDEVGLECWEHMVDILTKIGIMTKVSRNKLSRYCQAWQEWWEVQSYKKQLTKKQRLDLKADLWRQHVHWRNIAGEAEKVMSEFEREYGLTPSSAMKIRMPADKKPETPRDEFDRFVKAKPVKNAPIDVENTEES